MSVAPVAADQDVLVELVVEVGEQRGADRVEGRHDADALGGHLLRLLGRRALPDAERPGGLAADRGGEGHGGVDEQLPGLSTCLRLVSVSDWLRNGTLRITISESWTASAFSAAAHEAPGTCSAWRSAASCARPASREPITIGHAGAAEPHREPEAERAGASDDADGALGQGGGVYGLRFGEMGKRAW